MKKPSALELHFWALLTDAGYHDFQTEYKFWEGRQFRFDFAFPTQKLAVEIEGGVWMSKSRHTSGKGYTSDCIKYNEAQLRGWTVLRFTKDMLEADDNGSIPALEFIKRYFNERQCTDSPHVDR